MVTQVNDNVTKDLHKEIWNKQSEDKLPVVKSENQIEHDKDYEYVGKKLREFINDAEKVLDEAADVAVESGEAKAVEAYAQLLKVVGKLTKDIMVSSKEKAAIDSVVKAEANPPQGGDYNQTNIFVGTTTELAEMIKQNSLPPIDNDAENNT